MTDLIPAYRTGDPATALRGAVAGVGFDLHVQREDAGRRYVAFPDGLAVVIADCGGAFVVGTPTAWQVTIWEVTADGAPLTDEPADWETFHVEAPDTLARWVAETVIRLREDAVSADDDTPELVDAEETGMSRHTRRLRPGRHSHTTWPKERDVRLTGPTPLPDNRRSYQVTVDGIHLGWVVREETPRPAGLIRKERTRRIWRANPAFAHGVDLSQRGRESKRGAVAVLVAHWEAAHRAAYQEVPHA